MRNRRLADKVRQTGHRPFAGDAKGRAADFAPSSYQPFDRLTIHTTVSMTGTSISTPTTVARAAPELKPNRLIAAATANSKKLLAPISADGPATQCCSPVARFSLETAVGRCEVHSVSEISRLGCIRLGR